MSHPCLPVPVDYRHKKRRRGDRTPAEEPPTNEEIVFDDIESMDATEYLSRVVKEAKKMPDIFVSPTSSTDTQPSKRQREHVPIDGSAASLWYLNSSRASLTPTPTQQHLPQNAAWVETTMESFENLRKYLDECRFKGVGGKNTDRLALPPMKDRSGWHMFCLGKDDAQGNVGSYFGGDDDGDSGDDSPEDLPEWQKNIPESGHPPSVQLILQIDQVLSRRVLSHLAHFLCAGWPLTPQRSAWLYALLARLEKPVHREDAAILFGMLKALTVSRSNLNVETNRKELAKLNTLIAVIGIYFGQGGAAVMKYTAKS
jgi:survival of motor neuron protein-interacting protein 1